MAFEKIKNLLASKFAPSAGGTPEPDEHALLMGEGHGIAERLHAEHTQREANATQARLAVPRADFT